jgi:hypothetical protein
VGAKANHALAEIAAGDDDVARIVAGRLDGGRERRFRRRPGLSLAGAVAQSIEARGYVLKPVGDDMDDALLALQFAGAAQDGSAERGAAETIQDGRARRSDWQSQPAADRLNEARSRQIR